MRILKEDAASVPQTLTYRILYGLATLEDQDAALQSPRTAFFFAKCIHGADIEKCQEAACKEPEYAYRFFVSIPEANRHICYAAASKHHYWKAAICSYDRWC